MGGAAAAIAGCLVVALIGCAPAALPLLPALLITLPVVYGYALLAALPVSLLVAAPLYLLTRVTVDATFASAHRFSTVGILSDRSPTSGRAHPRVAMVLSLDE